MRSRTCLSLLFAFCCVVIVSGAWGAVPSHAKGELASRTQTEKFAVAPVVGNAQQVALGNGAVALMGPWKFRMGDSPRVADGTGAFAWAQPGFDDSGWQDYTLTAQGWPESILPERNASDAGWAGHGYGGAPSYGWYRIHVSLDRASNSLRLLVPRVDSAYTVYWDGHELGGYGDPSRRWAYYIRRSKVLSVPGSHGGIGDHVLAIRVWDAPLGLGDADRGGLRGAPLLADAATAPRIKQLALRLGQLNLAVVALTEVLPCLLVALVSLLLFFYNRKHLEYLWTGLTLAVFTVGDLLVMLDSFSATGWLSQTMYSAVNVLGASALLFSLLALQWLLGLEDRRKMLVANLIAGLLPLLLWMGFAINGVWPGSVKGAAFLFTATEVSVLACVACLLWMAGAGIRKLGREAWLMLSPGAVLSVLFFWVFFAYGRLPLPLLAVVTDILTILVPASVLAILIYRFVRQWREHQRLETDFENARQVQHILVPSTAPSVLGFAVESVYFPASEVGGDFFQILPGEDGSLLIVVGDVSGKGLKAAMTVSTIVGALRNEKERRPAEVLKNINRVLHGQITGFATCCAALIAADGRMTVANAGHLSPYRNGEEMAVEPGLPLGIVAKAAYEETEFQLAPGDRLTFISDGVVEATNEKRELFGFERTQRISNQPAAEIAEAARDFGQEDDITVLGIARMESSAAFA